MGALLQRVRHVLAHKGHIGAGARIVSERSHFGGVHVAAMIFRLVGLAMRLTLPGRARRLLR